MIIGIFNCFKKQVFWACIILLSALSSAYATESKSLFEVVLPTKTGNLVVEQPELLETALKQTFVQVSGSESVLNNKKVEEAIKQADKYVSKLSYHRAMHFAGEEPTQMIKILFNESKIKQLLKSTNQLIWDKPRPWTVIWCVVDKGEGQHWLGSGEELAVVEEINKNLSARAIPHLFPLFDLSETAQVSESDIFNESKEAIETLKQASEKYHPDIILLGKINQVEKNWQGKWTIVGSNENISWNTQHQELNGLLNQLAEDLTLKLSNQVVLVQNEKSQESHQVTIAIMGIMSAEQYGRVLDYLNHLPLVSKVEVAEVMSDKTLFHVYTTSDKERLSQAILNGPVFTENPSFMENSTDTLSYRLR